MNELNIYERFRDISIAHTNPVEWLECHGFGVGYIDMLDTNNLEQASYRKKYFYSEKWYTAGCNPNTLTLDFPNVLMLPVAGNGGVLTKTNSWDEEYNLVFYVADLMFRDRNDTDSSAYAKRTREELFAHTHEIGLQLLQEFMKTTGFQKIGDYRFEKFYDMNNKRLAGTWFEQKVKIVTPCEGSTFNYDKEFSEKKEKFCNC